MLPYLFNISFWTSVAPHAACPGCGQCSFLLRGSWRRSKSPTRQVGSVWPHNSTGSPFHGLAIHFQFIQRFQIATDQLTIGTLWSWDSSLYGTWWHAAGKRSRLKWHLPSFKWQCTRMTSSPLKTTVVSLRPRQRPKDSEDHSCHSCPSLMLNVHLCFLMPADASSCMAIWLHGYMYSKLVHGFHTGPFRILHVTKLRSAHDSLELTKSLTARSDESD